MLAARLRVWNVIAACVVSFLFSIYVAIRSFGGHALPDELYRLEFSLVTLLLAGWLVADSADRRRFSPSFDHGWFMFWALPIYGPYYLISTRRWKGVALCVAIVGLFLLPAVVELLARHDS